MEEEKKKTAMEALREFLESHEHFRPIEAVAYLVERGWSFSHAYRVVMVATRVMGWAEPAGRRGSRTTYRSKIYRKNQENE